MHIKLNEHRVMEKEKHSWKEMQQETSGGQMSIIRLTFAVAVAVFDKCKMLEEQMK